MRCINKKTNCNISSIIGIFFLSIAIRFVLANFYPKTINCYPDELLYLSFGESLWNNHALLVGNMPSVFDKAAYPILIAPSFIFSDVKVQGMMIALINSLLMSLGIFPVYGLAKRILADHRYVLFCAVLYAICPTLTYSMTFMSENLSVPLSLFCIYFVYRFWEVSKLRWKLGFGLLSALSMLLCYLTKDIALAFPIAFILVVLTDWVFGNNRKKRIGAILIGVVVVLAGIWIGFNRLFPGDILNKSGYVVFGFLFFLVFSVLGFCVIPVLLPGIHFRDMDVKSQKLYLFLMYTLVVTGAVVSCLIYTREDYPSLTPRAHLRYVEFLFIPLVVLLLRVIELKPVTASKRVVIGVFGVWAVMLLAVFQGFSGQTIDQTMLFYWQLFAKDGKVFSPVVVKVICVGIIVIIAGVMVLYYRKHEMFGRAVTIGLTIMCLVNSALSIFVQYKTHTHSEAETVEMEQLRDFVREHSDENFLVLEPENYCEMIDTFLVDCQNVRYGLGVGVMQDASRYVEPRDISYVIVWDEGVEMDADTVLVERYESLGYLLYAIEGDWEYDN